MNFRAGRAFFSADVFSLPFSVPPKPKNNIHLPFLLPGGDSSQFRGRKASQECKILMAKNSNFLPVCVAVEHESGAKQLAMHSVVAAVVAAVCFVWWLSEISHTSRSMCLGG